MRELKFRAWRNIDGKLQRYVFSPFTYEYPDADEPVFHAEYGVNDIRDFMPLADIIEQYTGLKDKNGKEIYEGDIIRKTIPIATNKSSTYRVFYKVDFATFEVAPIDGKIDILSGCFNFASMDNYEVIGNIHENPELLEGK